MGGSTTHKNENIIFFTSYTNKKGDQSMFNMWSREVDFNYFRVGKTGHLVGSLQLLEKYGNRFMISNEFIFVVKIHPFTEPYAFCLSFFTNFAEGWRYVGPASSQCLPSCQWHLQVTTSRSAMHRVS